MNSYFHLASSMNSLIAFEISSTYDRNLYIWSDKVFIFVCFLNQIIVERAPRSRAPELDKKKYLVPSDLTGKIHIHSKVNMSTYILLLYLWGYYSLFTIFQSKKRFKKKIMLTNDIKKHTNIINTY